MEVTFLIFTLLTVGTLGQDPTPLTLPSECCYKKTVGGEEYNQVFGNVPEGLNCKNDCVYEKAGDPGSRFCFRDGGVPVVCKEYDFSERPVNVTYSEKNGIMDWVSFEDTSLGNVNCTIGIDLDPDSSQSVICTIAMPIEIKGNAETRIESASGRASGIRQAQLMISGEEWWTLYIGMKVVHCIRIDNVCHFFPGMRNRVFVQDSFVDKIDNQADCQKQCDKDFSCTWWSFSATDDHPDHDDRNRVKRNHQGIPECGNRNYTVLRPSDGKPQLVDIFNKNGERDNRQSVGLRGNAHVYHGQTFAQEAFPIANASTPWECQNKCNAATDMHGGGPCLHWTFRLNPSVGPCVLSNYLPTRLISIFGPATSLIPITNIVSGTNTTLCSNCADLISSDKEFGK